MDVSIVDVPQAGRYEARVEGTGEVAGYADYVRTHELIAFVHTDVDPAYEGRGIGSALARTSLDAARVAGLRVLATCPFYAGWMSRHPEYLDLSYQGSAPDRPGPEPD